VIKDSAPDMSWIYLEYTDDMGHKFGISPQLDSAISMLDRQIGKVMQAVTYREQTYKEDWLVIITTDHGRDKETGKDHGGQSDSERNTWMVMNKKPNNYALNNRTAIVDIFPTITAFLNISLPSHIAKGLDGVPLLVTFR
jgi:predicted AlkP superfamily pyrophosphatase or phosphodiesterase